MRCNVNDLRVKKKLQQLYIVNLLQSAVGLVQQNFPRKYYQHLHTL